MSRWKAQPQGSLKLVQSLHKEKVKVAVLSAQRV